MKKNVVVIGAGINALVAANYLARAGCQVVMIERASKVGGACISETAVVDGIEQSYALGASVLGLMQDFVFEETGLAAALETFVPELPKLVHFPGDSEPTRIFRDPADLDRELAAKWGERGAVKAFREDEARVVAYLQEGYVNASPPSLDEAKSVLGETLVRLWITGSAREMLDHYFTSDRSKIYMAMTITESGPVSIDAAYSAFTLPLMDSGSIFGGYYGFVKGGIWQITEMLGRINAELGVVTHLDSKVVEINTKASTVAFDQGDARQNVSYDYLVCGSDPLTAARLLGDEDRIARTANQKFTGSSGKLNLMFRKPVRWKHGSKAADSDTAFRFLFSVESIEEFEQSTLKVLDKDVDYSPGYMQIYCEGAAMRQLDYREPFDRLAVFFKNLSLSNYGSELPALEQELKQKVLAHVHNPLDCAWSRLLTPRDLQRLFLFPGGNLDHTMLIGGQTFFDRNYSDDADLNFYRYGALENVYLCGSGSYPCGSVTGTPGYMCATQLLRTI